MKIKSYGLVTGAYWSLTLTDGALRMVVLLHFHELGFGPLELSFLFLAYEFMKINRSSYVPIIISFFFWNDF